LLAGKGGFWSRFLPAGKKLGREISEFSGHLTSLT